MNKKGFTLVESLLSLSVLGGVSVAGMQYMADEREKEKSYLFIKNVNDVINSVDARISIDGYDPDLWNKLSWNDESDIQENLIGKDLHTSSNCAGGLWNPTVNAESQTVLLPCNFKLNSKLLDIEMKAKITNDSAGFIQKFDIVLDFKNSQSLTDNLINIRSAMKTIDAYEKRENSGNHSMYFVNKADNNQEITSFECINDVTNCSLKASYDRSGGNEYLRADGANSMIGEHITFIESKGQSPMKCIRWANENRDGTGLWSQTLDEDCGIGIYKNNPHPVMLDVVADTGTFKNILLDKECKVYSWNGSNVIDSGLLSPCGTNNSTGEIYQVVENISSRQITTGILYADIAKFSVANIENIVAGTISATTINTINSLKTNIIEEYQAGFGTTFKDNVTIEDVLRVVGVSSFDSDVVVSGNTTFNGDVMFKQSLYLDFRDTQGATCDRNNETLSKDAAGEILFCNDTNKWEIQNGDFYDIIAEVIATQVHQIIQTLNNNGSVSGASAHEQSILITLGILGASRTTWNTGRIRHERFDDGGWNDQQFINWACAADRQFANGYIGDPQKSGYVTQRDPSGSHRSHTARCYARTFERTISHSQILSRIHSRILNK